MRAQVQRPSTARSVVGRTDARETAAARQAARAVDGLPAAPTGAFGAARVLPGGVPASVEATLREPGLPLTPAQRAWFEPRMGHDFGNVRIHADARAARSARAIGAHAYSAGEHIVFGAHRHAPQTRDGHRLLAHELAHVAQTGQRADLVMRDAVDLGLRFNDALAEEDWDGAVRALAEMPTADAASALRALSSDARHQLRSAAMAIMPTSPVGTLIEQVEQGAGTPAPSVDPAPAGPDIAALSATDKLGRAWGYTRSTLRGAVAHELEQLFSPRSLAMMAAFAALYIAAHLTPVAWIADALVLTLLSVTILFVGMLAIEVARDIVRFFTAVNATSEADLQASGQALSRALARGGVGLVVAILSRALPRGGPPRPGAAMAEAVVAGPGGMRMAIPAVAVEAVPAAVPARLAGLSYAVMVPPPGAAARSGGDSASPQAGGGGGSGSGPARDARRAESFEDVSSELGLEPRGTGAARGGGVAEAARDARAGGLIGPGGRGGTVDLAVQSHGTAPATRGVLGVTGADANSMHIVPTSVVRSLPGYSRGSALTTLGNRLVHMSLDSFWQRWAMGQRRAGRTTCTGAELQRVMIDAIDQMSGFTQAEKNVMAWRLQLEMQELGIGAGTTLPLPYPNIPAVPTP